MADVIEFSPKGEDKRPWAAGEAACSCGHEWTGVAPTGLISFECPSCGEMNGKWKHPFGPGNGDAAFTCSSCNSRTFFFLLSKRSSRTLILCTGCGEEMSIDDVFSVS